MTKQEARQRRYYLKHRERILADNLRAYRDDPATKRADTQQWRRDNPFRYQYSQAKHQAHRIGVEFLITLAEFIELWGDDIGRIGKTNDALCICRYGNTGAVAADNVYLATRSDYAAGARA